MRFEELSSKVRGVPVFRPSSVVLSPGVGSVEEAGGTEGEGRRGSADKGCPVECSGEARPPGAGAGGSQGGGKGAEESTGGDEV